MTNSQVLTLVIVFALLWAVNMGLGGMQARRFMRAVREVRMAGRTAIGLGGKRTRGKAYVALAVDAADRVVAATSLTGRTIFASPTPLPRVVGHHLTDLLEPASGPLGDSALGAATADAARHLQEATAADPEEDDPSSEGIDAEVPSPGGDGSTDGVGLGPSGEVGHLPTRRTEA